VECPPISLNDQQKNALENVKHCIVKTVMQLPHWGEEIPSNWIMLAQIFDEKKKNGFRILKRDELERMEELEFSAEEDLDDMLRFFQEIGHIIYFADMQLKSTVIINVQWFVDAFKHIITDRKHIPVNSKACDTRMGTGRISESTFHKIWNDSGDITYIQHQDDILPYMQKLGLITQKLRDSERDENMYYVPSMNRVDFSTSFADIINRGNKTSVFIFRFNTYLPHFFFFRLVVGCLEKWEALNQNMLCKSAAFYKTHNYSHCIAIAVNETSILLQVFTLGKEAKLKSPIVCEIRNEVQNCVADITRTFHEKVNYDIGYSCKDVAINRVDDDLFLSEDEVLKFEENIICPNHLLENPSHNIRWRDLVEFWSSDI
jgi:hypothetical protein